MPAISAVIAASSATGRSAVPAQTTVTPSWRGIGVRSTVRQRAASWCFTSGTAASTAAAISGVARVTSSRSDALQQRRGDAGDLLRRLPQPQHHFGHPVPQGAVVVHPREADIFVWQQPKLIHRRLDIGAAVRNRGQQFPQPVLFHDVAPAWL